MEHCPKDEAGSGSFSGQRNSGALTGVGVLLRVGLRIPCYTEWTALFGIEQCYFKLVIVNGQHCSNSVIPSRAVLSKGLQRAS